MPLSEADELLDAELPEGGLGHASAGSCSTWPAGSPHEGEAVEVDGFRLVAERVQGRRIGRVRIERAPGGRGAERAGD